MWLQDTYLNVEVFRKNQGIVWYSNHVRIHSLSFQDFHFHSGLVKTFKFQPRQNDATINMVICGHFTLANLREYYRCLLSPFFIARGVKEKRDCVGSARSYKIFEIIGPQNLYF